MHMHNAHAHAHAAPAPILATAFSVHLSTQVESPDSKKQTVAMEEEVKLEREKVASRDEHEVAAPAPAHPGPMKHVSRRAPLPGSA